MNLAGVYAAYVYVCECGERFVGGAKDQDAGTRTWMNGHEKSRMHQAWVERRKRETCTHAGRTSIVPLGAPPRYMRRCDECWRYLYETDAEGNSVALEGKT